MASYPIVQVLNSVNTDSKIDDFKKIIESKEMCFKEDDEIMLVFTDSTDRTGDELVDTTRSFIFDKKTCTPIASQFNNIIYNADAIKFLQDKNWNDVRVFPCYEGTTITVFNHNGKWYRCTRKCIDAYSSYWIPNVSYGKLFDDTIEGKFKVEDLNPDYCYQFILLHDMNKNIIQYNIKNVVHICTTKKGTLEEIDCVINAPIMHQEVLHFANIEEVNDKLKELAKQDACNQTITTEGFVLRHYKDGITTTLKLQTTLYAFIAKNKPNVSNVDLLLMNLYQTGLINNIGIYFTKSLDESVAKIKNSLNTLASEILTIYHNTRKHSNEQLYNALPGCYKTLLYGLHKVYLDRVNSKLAANNSIDWFDVYNYLKTVDIHLMKGIYMNRLQLIENPILKNFIHVNCFDSYMFSKSITK